MRIKLSDGEHYLNAAILNKLLVDEDGKSVELFSNQIICITKFKLKLMKNGGKDTNFLILKEKP